MTARPEHSSRPARPMLLYPGEFEAFASRMRAGDSNAELRAAEAETAAGLEPDYTITEGVAIIDINGYIMPTVPYRLRDYATGMDQLEANILAAVNDRDAQAIMLAVNSPGGYTTGVETAAGAIARARALMPVSAHIDGICASAAYWLASQAGMVTATRSSMIGSIGTYMVANDLSRFWENMGVATHVLSSAEGKTFGDEYSERPTRRQLENYRAIISGLTALFVEAVSYGRKVSLERAQEWATGEIWLTTQAIEKGLADDSATFLEVFSILAQASAARRSAGGIA